MSGQTDRHRKRLIYIKPGPTILRVGTHLLTTTIFACKHKEPGQRKHFYTQEYRSSLDTTYTPFSMQAHHHQNSGGNLGIMWLLYAYYISRPSLTAVWNVHLRKSRHAFPAKKKKTQTSSFQESNFHKIDHKFYVFIAWRVKHAVPSTEW